MIERISSLILRRQRGHLLGILANRTIGGSTTKIAYFGKEADGCVLVPGPLIRQIILIEDASVGHTGSQAPQSTHSFGLMYSEREPS